MDTSDKIESIFVNSWIRIIAAMLLSFIKGIVSRASASVSASSASSVVLGRWGIQYDPKIIRIKIDQANEDHCGCCIPPAADVVKVVGADAAKATTKTRYEKIQEYLLPYVL